ALEFVKPGTNEPDYASPAQVTRLLNEEFKNQDLDVKRSTPHPTTREGGGRYSSLILELADPVDISKLKSALTAMKTAFENSPQPERLVNRGSQLAAPTRERALYAILGSCGAILLYLWFRFGSWTFGLAAVLCLI